MIGIEYGYNIAILNDKNLYLIKHAKKMYCCPLIEPCPAKSELFMNVSGCIYTYILLDTLFQGAERYRHHSPDVQLSLGFFPNQIFFQ